MRLFALAFIVLPLLPLYSFTPVTEDLPQQNLSLDDGNEALSNLNHIIQATRDSYTMQMNLRQSVLEYQKLQQQYLQNPNDRALLFTLAKKADQVMTAIQENHLAHAFDNEFLKEVSMFTRISKKTTRPQP